MITSAWNNGERHSSGAGYGLRISSEKRDAFFERSWKSVAVEIPMPTGLVEVEVNIAKKSFWDPICGELIKIDIGRWLISQGFSEWEKGNPPQIELRPVGDTRFRIIGIAA